MLQARIDQLKMWIVCEWQPRQGFCQDNTRRSTANQQNEKKILFAGIPFLIDLNEIAEFAVH